MSSTFNLRKAINENLPSPSFVRRDDAWVPHHSMVGRNILSI
jgi:hypothetical protein